MNNDAIMNDVPLDMILIGCAVLLAYYAGRLARRLKLSPVVGHVAVGAILGPSAAGVINHELMGRISFITDISIGFMTFVIGMAISFDAVGRWGRKIVSPVVGQAFSAFAFVFAAIYALTFDLPLALVLAGIAPVFTVTAARCGSGDRSVEKSLWSLAGFGNGLALVVFVLAVAFAKVILAQESAAAGGMTLPGAMIPMRRMAEAVLLGGAVGIGLSYIAAYASNPREVVVGAFGAILVAAGLSLRLNLPVVLTCLTVGVAFANGRRAGLAPAGTAQEIHGVMPIILVFFFCLAGAHFDAKTFRSAALIALVYAFARTAGSVIGVSFGSALADLDEKIKRSLGLGILSQAGIAIGLALCAHGELAGHGATDVSERAFAIGSSVVVVIIATGVFLEVACAVLSKIEFRMLPALASEQEQLLNGGRIARVVNRSERQRERQKPEWLAVKAFAIAIIVGTILLCLPFASKGAKWTNPLTALFTATSATCVTGLSVVDVGTYFSKFGQIVLLCLMQVGGLGIMTLGTFLLLLVGRRLSMRDEVVLRDSFGSERARGVISLLSLIVLFTIVLELASATVLAHRFASVYGYAPRRATYYGIFHAVSGFCNAGLSLYRDSLAEFKSDPVVLLTMSFLIVMGGLGFLVLYNLSSIRPWRRNRIQRGHLSLHSKIALGTTLALILAGWAGFMALEINNTLAPLDRRAKILTAFFHSITPRTAGFNVVDVGAMEPSTLYATMALMFVGGSPGSTAGGIKTTTALVLLLSVLSMIRGRERTELAGRTVSMQIVREALSIFLLAIFSVIVCFGVLLLTESLPPSSGGFSGSERLLFETVSAFGTVGLSTGITSQLSVFGKLCIIAAMFIGRIGPLTIALVVGEKELRRAVRFPEEEVVVG